MGSLGSAGRDLTVIASLVSFCLLVFSMHRLPLGTAYAVWTGNGKLLGRHCCLGESANVWRIASAALMVLGVCGLRVTRSL